MRKRNHKTFKIFVFFIGESTLQIRNVWELGIFSSAIQDEQLKSFCAIMSIQNLFTLMPQGPIVIIFPSLFLNKDDNIHISVALKR